MNNKHSNGAEVVSFIEEEFQDLFDNEKILKGYVDLIQGKDFIFIDGFDKDYEDPEKTSKAIEALLVFKYKEIQYQDNTVNMIIGNLASHPSISRLTKEAVSRINSKISNNANLKLIEHIDINNSQNAIYLLNHAHQYHKALYATYGGGEDAVERLKYTEQLGMHQEIYPKYDLDSQVLMIAQLEDPDFKINPVLENQLEGNKVN